MKFQWQKIVVIGGSSGMGLATAKMAAAEGAAVIIASRSEEKLRKAKEQIKGKVEILAVNVIDEGSVKAFFEKVGVFNHLTTPGSELSMGRFLDWLQKQHGPLATANCGDSTMRPNTVPPKSDPVALSPFSPESGVKSRSSVVTAINSAIEGLGRALAVELAPIRVNTVSPGNPGQTHCQARRGRPDGRYAGGQIG